MPIYSIKYYNLFALKQPPPPGITTCSKDLFNFFRYQNLLDTSSTLTFERYPALTMIGYKQYVIAIETLQVRKPKVKPNMNLLQFALLHIT